MRPAEKPHLPLQATFKPRLLDQVRRVLPPQHTGIRTSRATLIDPALSCSWQTHPSQMGKAEVSLIYPPGVQRGRGGVHSEPGAFGDFCFVSDVSSRSWSHVRNARRRSLSSPPGSRTSRYKKQIGRKAPGSEWTPPRSRCHGGGKISGYFGFGPSATGAVAMENRIKRRIQST